MKQLTDIECKERLDSLNLPSLIREKLDQHLNHHERADYHPEDNAYIHIARVWCRALELGNIDIIATAILHDICKWDCRVLKPDGKFAAPGHDKKGAEFIMNNPQVVQGWIKSIGANIETVTWITAEHMRAKLIGQMKQSKVDLLLNHPDWNKLAAFGWIDDMLLTDMESITGAKNSLKTGEI